MTDTDQERAENARVDRLARARTPGPWRNNGGQIEESFAGGCIATVGIVNDQSMTATANATLIAAAPDLLDVAQEALDVLDVGAHNAADPEGCMKRLREVLARATGASS